MPTESLVVIADVAWLPNLKNLPNGVPFSGMRPSFLIQGDRMACDVTFVLTFVPEKPHIVRIWLAYGTLYSEHIRPGLRFELTVDRTTLANGQVLKIEDIQKMSNSWFCNKRIEVR